MRCAAAFQKILLNSKEFWKVDHTFGGTIAMSTITRQLLLIAVTKTTNLFYVHLLSALLRQFLNFAL